MCIVYSYISQLMSDSFSSYLHTLYCADNGSRLCELLAAMQSVYCGHFATLETGARLQHIVYSAGHLETIDSSSNKHSSIDNSQLLFTCKVAAMI